LWSTDKIKTFAEKQIFAMNDSFDVLLKHRNYNETWSALQISFVGNVSNYDLSTSAEQAYGNNLKLIAGIYVIYGGDVNQDGIIDSGDMIPVDNEAAVFNTGYIVADVNGDGIINALDINIVGNNATQFVGKRTP
jgi:hypothetical protein